MNTTPTHITRIALAAAVATLCLTTACGSSDASAASATERTWPSGRPVQLPMTSKEKELAARHQTAAFTGHTTPPPSYWIGYEVWQRRAHVL